MVQQNAAYFLALASAIFFSGASVIFARYAVSHSALWMNLIKNTVASFAFIVTTFCLFVLGIDHWTNMSVSSLSLLILSGCIGLAIGDVFLFAAYKRIGSARAIMVFSFSPVFLCVEGYLIFGQKLSMNQLIAILLMIACVWTISLEKFKTSGTWEWRGLLYALIGVSLDNMGVVFTRMAFDQSPQISSFYANGVRGIGAVVLLSIYQYWRGEKIFSQFGRLPPKDRSLTVFASFVGTFLSLSCWLTALKVGHVGSLAGVGSFNPVAASLWEWVLLKKRPSKYLLVALGLFLSGFYLLLYAN
ncbi:MAG: DMT family transporter [Oligoflexia bacterium]|nr:DMT family transporter [Oligoflexia bacterium]